MEDHEKYPDGFFTEEELRENSIEKKRNYKSKAQFSLDFYRIL